MEDASKATECPGPEAAVDVNSDTRIEVFSRETRKHLTKWTLSQIKRERAHGAVTPDEWRTGEPHWVSLLLVQDRKQHCVFMV